MKVVQGIMMTLAAIIPLYLTGCVNAQDIKDSLAANDEYKQYLEIKEKNELDSEGTVIPPSDGDILVSIAKNQYLDIQYKLTDGTNVGDYCYLHAGDSLLIGEPVKQNASSMYRFDGFKLKSNDGFDVDFEVESAEDNTYRLTIPENYRGKNLTVLPYGKFEERSVVCRAVVLDGDNNQTTANGTWGLSGDIHCDVNTPAEMTTLTFSGTEGYSVKYQFDGNYYYVENTSDVGATITENSVLFPSMKPSDATPEYTIKFRKYITLNFENFQYIDSITVNSVATELEDSRLTKLKQYDVVNVKLKKGAFFEKSDYTNDSRELSDGCKEYTITLPKSERADLKIGFENAPTENKNEDMREVVNISYTDQNGEQISADKLKDGEKYDITITVKENSRYKLVDNGFYIFNIGQIVDKNGTAKLSKIPKNECDQKIDEVLDKCLKKIFAVYLSESDEKGTFEYSLDGDKLTVKSGNPVNVYTGQKLDVTFTANNGYKIPGVGAFGTDGTKKKVTIEIPDDWEGKTLSLGDFGIEVKE